MKVFRFFTTLALIFLSLSSYADGMSIFKDSIMVTVLVNDDFTGETIGNAVVEIYDANAVLVAKENTNSSASLNNNRLANCSFFVPRTLKNATIKVVAEKYEIYSKKVEINVGRRENGLALPTIHLKHKKNMKEVQLDGITVTASKVKMVMHGDTIVYNADAFQLSNGSMLDELIRRLPGVQLKGNQIMVNGRFVSSLLVNGSDFFKGDPAVALQNLPAYTVNKLEVYEKQDDIMIMTGQKKEKGENPLVMDVSLKRQYMQGMLVNFDLGYGTHDRWMARLFALRYTKLSRIGIFSNLNNTNDTRSPGINGEWNPSQQQDGLTTQRTFGIDYQLTDVEKTLEFTGNTTYAYNNVAKEQIESSERFLTGGNTFRRNRSHEHYSTSYVQSQNFMRKVWPSATLYLFPNFTYYKSDDKFITHSANFNAAPNERYRGAALDSLFASPASKRFHDAMMNRFASDIISRQHSYDANVKGIASFKLPKSPDYIILDTENKLNNFKRKKHNIYNLDYKDSDRDFRNKYNTQSTTDLTTRWKATYSYAGTFDYKYSFDVSLEYTHNYSRDNSDLFRLDKYAEYGVTGNAQLGYLPSTRDSLLHVIDADNSYHSRIYKDRWELSGHTPAIKLHILGLNASFEPGINYRRERIDYTRGLFSKRQTRELWSWEPTLKISKNNCTLLYKVRKTLPELTDILDFTSTDNPLNIWHGNPNLKNTDIHSIDFRRNIRKYDKNWTCTRNILINAYWQVMRNAIGQYVEYNRQTGGVRSTPMNINGNWNAGALFEFTGTIDKKKRLMLNTKTEVGYTNSVDYAAVDGQSADNHRSSVRSVTAGEMLTLDYSFGKYAFGAKLRCVYMHAESPRSDFNTINTADADYGLNATVELPLKLKLSTDITMYCRYGYSDPSMNTSNLVWNTRLERTFGKFTVVADGFDILGKLSNVRKVINAQGRTETWYNTVPRYAMLHIMYKLHFKPRK
ncbi:outer membrane beta-barrel protein [uncultured Prevotella sp.]|uniref:outer membrane beta-barrel protein n=1 Tax=uncultured Prevotella sp. TaxID=159272 RepID=UPI002614B098|nr:outer membrane beta-barrel protein [uncultured Prevotella sp.]